MEETISNRMEQVLGEWVCLHDEAIHFPTHNPEKPAIKLCHKSLRVRANDAWSKLPKNLKEASVAHELGHREYQHYLTGGSQILRAVSILNGVVYKNELQADNHAAKLLGRQQYIGALRAFLSYFDGPAYQELMLRIKLLEAGK